MMAEKGLGRIVERSPTKALSGGPFHPYTRALLSAIPGREAPEGGARASQGRHGLAPLSLPTFWVVMATADVPRNEDAPEGEEVASAAFPPRSGV